ncbi:MAG: UbiH/UbiF/VisC/COQ6 family ubiquinone biosynthesis hydroxylase [Thiohalomonadales bacterium]
MVKKAKYYDVIIIGGGMVGALCALALARSNLSIAVVEGKTVKSKWPQQSFDMRVSALTRASQNMLSHLQVWPQMADMAVQPFSDMHVWDSGGSGEIHFDCADIGETCLGHIVENRVIHAALWKKLKESPQVDVICPAQASAIQIDKHSATIEFSDRGSLSGKLLVAADGSRSWVREQLGIEVEQGDYHQTALVTTVKTEFTHQDTAWQRFLPTGPLAFLPLRDGYSSIVWSTANEQAAQLLALDEAAFSIQLANALQSRLGTISDIRQRAEFPLQHMHAKHYVLSRLALVGDAAHTIHPLAGQGVNLGFADASCLADVVSRALKENRDIGAFGTLRQYERWRRGENALILNGMTALKQLFGSENSLIKIVRNIGLTATSRANPVRNQIIRLAMGLRGDLSSLARP